MSGDPDQDYFADGVVEDIITALSRVRWIFVIARNSSFAYKGQTRDIRKIGGELGVRYVLEGSSAKSRNQVRINGELIMAETGRNLWADRFDGELSDIFNLQDRIIASVVSAIEPQILSAEIDRARVKSTVNLSLRSLSSRLAPYLCLHEGRLRRGGGASRARAGCGRQVFRRLDSIVRLPRPPNHGGLDERIGPLIEGVRQ
jgi:adenylate cyclase